MTEISQELSGINGGVVVGTDVSEGGRGALRFAATEALLRHAPLHVLRAWSLSNAPRPATARFGEVPSLAEYEVAVRVELADEVSAVLAEIPGADQLTVIQHVVHGPATSALVTASAHADLLVVGARGRGGFLGLLLGGISDQVVRFSVCPVVIVPARQARLAAQAGRGASTLEGGA